MVVGSVWLGEASVVGGKVEWCGQGFGMAKKRSRGRRRSARIRPGLLYGARARASSRRRARRGCQREGEGDHGVVLPSSSRGG
jgi:hypothetical protein